jgi:hypothetical protein
MTGQSDAVLRKDLAEARAAVARHGIVIVRAIEEDLVPATMAAVRDSLSSSPERLEEMDEKELDHFVDDLRKTATKEAFGLRDVLVRVLADIGVQGPRELAGTVDGSTQLFGWDRIARTGERVNEKLVKRGFQPLQLSGPGDVSESFEIELVERWPAAMKTFKDIVVSLSERPPVGESEKAAAPRPKRKGGRGRKR